MGIWDAVERVGGIGAEIGGHFLEGIPGVGAIPALIHGGIHADHYKDAELDARLHPENAALDRDKMDYYSGQQSADLAHAVPLLGAGLELSELIMGGVSAIQGNGFTEGMERQRDGEIEMIDWLTGTNASDVENRTAQRHRIEGGE